MIVKMTNEKIRKKSAAPAEILLAISSSSFEIIFNFKNESIVLNIPSAMKPKIIPHFV